MFNHIKLIHNSKLLHSNSEEKFLKACHEIASVKSSEALKLLLEVFTIRNEFTYLQKKELINIFCDIGKIDLKLVKENVFKEHNLNYILTQVYFKLCNKSEIVFLIELYEKTQSSILISSAGSINSEETAKWLLAMLEKHNFVFKKEAIESLKSIAFENKENEFISFLDNNNHIIRYEAAIYLNKDFEKYHYLTKFKISFALLKWIQLQKYEVNEDVYNYIIKFADDADPNVRINILQLILKYKKLEYHIAVKYLWDSDSQIRSLIGNYLMKDADYVGEIIYMLNDENSDVRKKIEQGLIDNINTGIIEKAVEIYEIEVSNSRNLYLLTSLQNLFVISGEICVEKLLSIVSEENIALTESVFEIFEEIQSEKICQFMYRILEGENAELASNALDVLQFQNEFADVDKIRSAAIKLTNSQIIEKVNNVISLLVKK